MRLKKRFSQIEFPEDKSLSTDKDSSSAGQKFKRKIEFGDDVKKANLKNDMQKVANQLEKDLDELAIRKDKEMKLIAKKKLLEAQKKVIKEKEEDILLRERIARSRIERSKNMIWIAGISLLAVPVLYFIIGQDMELLLMICVTVILSYLRFLRRNRY